MSQCACGRAQLAAVMDGRHSGHVRVTEIGIPDILVKNEVTWTCGMAMQSQKHPLQSLGGEIASRTLDFCENAMF